eukprot:4357533-Pyramimonas_sp.AAC.2
MQHATVCRLPAFQLPGAQPQGADQYNHTHPQHKLSRTDLFFYFLFAGSACERVYLHQFVRMGPLGLFEGGMGLLLAPSERSTSSVPDMQAAIRLQDGTCTRCDRNVGRARGA